uniref:Suppressor of forked domain-containing protein n=1 Tax=Haptolina ericina TaxID=156174 RepID=A0A7S3ER36_9EUKA|mmetsp:Transcript_15431/g.34508  ORF Transcript_15431/g.34508 Transcript_15431/m.34508 type:complete len:671 (+) Transcript_15431:32-2044(+)
MGDRMGDVKNKQPAPMQISAEQILREARERQEDENYTAPAQKITDPEELAVYRLRERKHFEDRLRMSRNAMGTWLKYASFEEAQRDFERARSVYERALDVDHRNTTVWLKYAEMEMRNRHINRARNVWDRAVTLMPRVDQFWFKYIYMEEMLGNVSGARALFDRWVEWEPDDHAWSSYVRLELRANQPSRARKVHERWVECHNFPRSWIKWAKFEEKQGETANCRAVYEGALQNLDERDHTEELFISFAQFEERAKESDRARVIYKYALDALPRSEAQDLYKKYVLFEKQRGDRSGIEDVISSKKRFQYEEVLKKDPYMYDTWYDYVRLEESFVIDAVEPDFAATRDVYERAIANVPPAPEKRLWRRYIYLWLRYAIFEELIAKDPPRARQVLAECRRIVPHKSFTFAKLWVHSAHMEIRQGDLGGARRLLGNAIGRCPKDKLFKEYVQLELQLGEVQRCRQLYHSYLQWNPENCAGWVAFAELEASLGEIDRTRAIYDLAITQPSLDMPESLWKSYIDFEIELGEVDRTRRLYRELLERTKHVKVWLSFAQFESGHGDSVAAVGVYKEAESHFKETGLKEERFMMLESWQGMESEIGDADRIDAVKKRMPIRLKKKRPLQSDDGQDLGWEEYYDYVYPEEQAKAPSLKILEMAHKWKKQKVVEPDDEAA